MASVCAYVEERNARYGLAFKVETDSACRVCELGFGREALGGIETRADGTEVGLLKLVGKGGRPRIVEIGAELYRELDRRLEEGRVLVKPDAYRKAVYRAQRALGLRCCGTHKVRRTSAQAFFSAQYRELRNQGLASTEASRQGRQATAERLGHRRVRITRAYVRG